MAIRRLRRRSGYRLNETFGKTLVTGMRQSYWIARSGGNSQTATRELCELA
jgi:hypothetical protein